MSNVVKLKEDKYDLLMQLIRDVEPDTLLIIGHKEEDDTLVVANTKDMSIVNMLGLLETAKLSIITGEDTYH